MSDFSIRDVVSKVSSGTVRIPAFQRGFVWEPESVAFLMDSIYKGYPFGTIQLWRTREALRTERKLGPFELFEREADYPIDYVLDGQQRLTSIFGVFQTDITLPPNEENPFNIYFDFQANLDAQESQFYALNPNEIDPLRHFPLNCLFDTVAYRAKTQDLSATAIQRIDNLQAIFKEAKIPYQTLETEDRTKVAIVFERINRKGVPLDTFQLLSAWTWSEDFALQSKFEDLTDELRPYGFEEVGGNINLLLRICSAILSNNSSSSALLNINGSVVRNRFDEISNGVRGAIDFVKGNFKVERLDNLPYDTILVPLSVFFSNVGNTHFNYTNEQRIVLEKWFWRACFSRRYSAGVSRALDRDIEEIIKLKNSQPSNLASFTANVGKEFFQDNSFLMGTVNTRTFILVLAQLFPRSFISGSLVSLSNVLKEYNRNEFHHIYPKAFLNTQPQPLPFKDNCLANFCFMSRADNKKLSGEAPSLYRRHMTDDLTERLQSALLEETSLFADNYRAFIERRTEMLLLKVGQLIN
jgi:hypothetical protein